MNDFIAKNPKQLDLCLRLLYAEGADFFVKVGETDKGKIVYIIKAEADYLTVELLKEKYRILIS